MDKTTLVDLLERKAQEIAAAGHNGWGNTMLEAARAVREAVPDGWVLVPREPTEAMIEAGMTTGPRFADAYTAMIEAAEDGGRHEWDREGERCLKCGAKDWMNVAKCSPSRSLPDMSAAPTQDQENGS